MKSESCWVSVPLFYTTALSELLKCWFVERVPYTIHFSSYFKLWSYLLIYEFKRVSFSVTNRSVMNVRPLFCHKWAQRSTVRPRPAPRRKQNLYEDRTQWYYFLGHWFFWVALRKRDRSNAARKNSGDEVVWTRT